MAQTVYNSSPDAAFPGMVADNGLRDDRSFTNEGTAALKAGLMIVQGTDEDDGILPSSTGQDPIGVVLHFHNTDQDLASGEVVGKDSLGVVRKKGRVWVRVEEAIALGDAVYFRHTSGTGTEIGAFRNDADTSTCDQVSNARWSRPSATYNGVLLAELELNLP